MPTFRRKKATARHPFSARSVRGVALQQRALLAGSIYVEAGTLRVIAGLLAIPIDQRTRGQGRISQ
jgi:hypothetical protein